MMINLSLNCPACIPPDVILYIYIYIFRSWSSHSFACSMQRFAMITSRLFPIYLFLCMYNFDLYIAREIFSCRRKGQIPTTFSFCETWLIICLFVIENLNGFQKAPKDTPPAGLFPTRKKRRHFPSEKAQYLELNSCFGLIYGTGLENTTTSWWT